MRVLHQILPPGVEHGQEADLRAQMLRISGDGVPAFRIAGVTSIFILIPSEIAPGCSSTRAYSGVGPSDGFAGGSGWRRMGRGASSIYEFKPGHDDSRMSRDFRAPA